MFGDPPEAVERIVGDPVLRIGVAALAPDAVVAAADPPASRSAVFGVAVVLVVLRLRYRLHTYPPAGAA
ncbi:hypothetical protein [Halorarum halobium]|uniref:hypothetical protein n=1 Tax=Halorarum halobium TaxID=3075121 RepID=UPI0028AF59D4|nr:hypothetical protein [Halobaculum sp. XH14]